MLKSKISTLLTDGIEPYQQGKNNFDNPDSDTEYLAKQRADICSGCRFFRKEPISFLRVADKRIPVLSEMACGKCGCELSYKTRQSIKTCSKWRK